MVGCRGRARADVAVGEMKFWHMTQTSWGATVGYPELVEETERCSVNYAEYRCLLCWRDDGRYEIATDDHLLTQRHQRHIRDVATALWRL